MIWLLLKKILFLFILFKIAIAVQSSSVLLFYAQTRLVEIDSKMFLHFQIFS